MRPTWAGATSWPQPPTATTCPGASVTGAPATATPVAAPPESDETVTAPPKSESEEIVTVPGRHCAPAASSAANVATAPDAG